MSRGALLTVVVVLVLGAAVAGLFLWERTRSDSSSESEARTERLLIGLNPQTVRRVRFSHGDRTMEFKREPSGWEPVTASSQSITVRVDVLLLRIATLRVRLVTGAKSRRRKLGRPLVELKVWRGQARPIIVRLYRPGRILMITTSDRPGIYQTDPKLLTDLRRELQQPRLPPIWPLKPLQLASVEVQTQTSVTLVRRKGRWFLEDSSALAPADSTAVGRLLRALESLRVTHRLGQGAAAVTKHGLDKPRVTVRVDDGSKRTLRLGGPCPRSKDSVVATVGGKVPAVVCVTNPEPRSLTGPFVSARLFSLAADEIKAIRVTRGKRILALENHPGSGGWKMSARSSSQRVVDQLAAASFLADMAQIAGQAPGNQASQLPPDKLRRVGSVAMTPLVGSEESLDLFAASRKEQTLWVRRVGGARWIRIRPTDTRLLTADPVLLRSRNLCSEPGKRILRLTKTQPGRVTELVQNQRGIWQLVLLTGKMSFKKATRIGAKLEQYRPAARQGATPAQAMVWRRPVLLVSNPDRVHLNTLLHHIKAIRAQAFVASRARKVHGLGPNRIRLSFFYQHSCKTDAGGKKQCQHARCNLELGSPRPGSQPQNIGGCYARQADDPAVFVANEGLCRAARTPLANRRAIRETMLQLTSITLRKGRKTRRLVRAPNGGWKRPPEVSALAWESAAGALLQLAPLTAQAVDGYGRGRARGRGKGKNNYKLELTVVLTVSGLPAMQLDFFDDGSDSKHRWMVRKGLPMRYKVSKRMVRGLEQLAGFK